MKGVGNCLGKNASTHSGANAVFGAEAATSIMLKDNDKSKYGIREC
jgi:hypothetical protein